MLTYLKWIAYNAWTIRKSCNKYLLKNHFEFISGKIGCNLNCSEMLCVFKWDWKSPGTLGFLLSGSTCGISYCCSLFFVFNTPRQLNLPHFKEPAAVGVHICNVNKRRQSVARDLRLFAREVIVGCHGSLAWLISVINIWLYTARQLQLCKIWVTCLLRVWHPTFSRASAIARSESMDGIWPPPSPPELYQINVHRSNIKARKTGAKVIAASWVQIWCQKWFRL